MSPRIPLAAVISVFALVLCALPAIAGEEPDAGVVATFEGGLINLEEGWGEARACVVWGNERAVECFRSETDLVAHIESVELDPVLDGLAPLASQCSTSLKLYDGTSYTGAVLYLYQRTTWINLSNHGWDNRTSSFKIGACSSIFADGSNGSGDRYPLSLTAANDVASAMLSGWNNRVSSVYIG